MPPLPKFYATEEEKAWAKKERSSWGGYKAVMFALSGSSVHKVWPHMDGFFARLMIAEPDIRIITVGDEMSQMLECGWEKEPRVICKAGKYSIRETLALLDHGQAALGILMQAFQIVLECAEGRRPCEAEVIVARISGDVPLLHNVDDGFCVVVVEGNAVGSSRSAVGRESHGRGAGATSRNNAQRGAVELLVSSAVHHLHGVVLENLHHGIFHRELGQVFQLAAVRDAVAILGDRQGALSDREVGFRHGVGFSQRVTLRNHVGNHVPCEGVTLLFALLRG